jgi:hypothetical protein
MSISDETSYDAWRTWTLDDVVRETEKILRLGEYPPNASFSPMALHYYREGILLELRHRNEAFATTWLSEHPSKEALCQWAAEQATAFVNQRKRYKRRLLRRRAQS